MTNNPNTNTKRLVPLMNKEDSGERKERTITRLFSAIVLNLLPKEINMMFHGYLVWSLNHNITKVYLSVRTNTLSTCTVCQTKKQRRFTASFRRKKCYEGTETNFKGLNW